MGGVYTALTDEILFKFKKFQSFGYKFETEFLRVSSPAKYLKSLLSIACKRGIGTSGSKNNSVI